MKRALAALLATLTVVALAGCTPVSIHAEDGPPPCVDGEAYVTFSVDATRPGRADVPESRPFPLTVPITVILQAVSPDPTYGGVNYLDVNHPQDVTIGAVNPLVLERTSPYGAQACWDGTKPVAFLLRAFFNHEDIALIAYDELSCEIEDGDHLNADGFDFLEANKTRVELTDLIDYKKRNDPFIGVQCQYVYTPMDWTGEHAKRFPDMEPRP